MVYVFLFYIVFNMFLNMCLLLSFVVMISCFNHLFAPKVFLVRRTLHFLFFHVRSLVVSVRLICFCCVAFVHCSVPLYLCMWHIVSDHVAHFLKTCIMFSESMQHPNSYHSVHK